MRASPLGREVLSFKRRRVAKQDCKSGLWQKGQDCKSGFWQKGQDCKSGPWQKGQDCKSGLWQKGFWVDVASIVGASGRTYIPAINASVNVKRLGSCTVLEVDVRICNTRLHRFIMNTHYEEIHA